MTGRTVKRVGGAIAAFGLVPASGPVLLGLVRDDIHAHSGVGDLGLQAITLAGWLIVLLGGILVVAPLSSERPVPTSREPARED